MVIAWLAANGGWGLGRMQIDFSIEVNDAPLGTPLITPVQRPGYYLPDCDSGVDVPVPPGGAIEGVSGYQCSNADRHLIIHDPATARLSATLRSKIALACRLPAGQPAQ
jgi:hypothetical protein